MLRRTRRHRRSLHRRTTPAGSETEEADHPNLTKNPHPGRTPAQPAHPQVLTISLDALLRTAGALSAFTFVEIKKPGTPLLRTKPYRSGAWAVSEEVAGGVAQLHATVDGAQNQIGLRQSVTTAEGADTGETIEFCRPRSLLVVGSLEQMIHDGGVHHPRHRSFEAFRRSIRDPEIVTYDEILYRAQAVLSTSGEIVKSCG